MADTATTGSRRSALRFSGYDRAITYLTDYDEGQALLVNISTSGCAIYQASAELYVDQKLLVCLMLDNPEKPLYVRAVVIRAEGGSYGLQFQHIEENSKRRIIRFFARETRRRKGAEASHP